MKILKKLDIENNVDHFPALQFFISLINLLSDYGCTEDLDKLCVPSWCNLTNMNFYWNSPSGNFDDSYEFWMSDRSYKIAVLEVTEKSTLAKSFIEK